MLSRTIPRASRFCIRCYSTGTTTTPPMLLKLRKDLKTAMQNKDTTRLTVLRSLLSQTLNASKTSNPITTDSQFLSLLRKSVAAAQGASTEFADNGRKDLADKENAQINIMQEYASGVEVVGSSEIKDVVKRVVNSMKEGGESMKMGEVLKKVFSPESGFGDKPLDKAEVAKVVKELLEMKS